MIHSEFGEIMISETRKSKKDEQLDNRELELEERELQWWEKEFEEERRKRMRMEEKMEEEKKDLEMKIEKLEMEVENVVVDLRRELSKLKEVLTSESSVAENGRNEELVSQMGCSREAPNEASSEKDKFVCCLRIRRGN